MNIKLTLGRRVKSAAALPRAFGFGKSMGLLSGVICVIALFSLLQLFSTVFISNILRDAKVNLVTGDALHRQQATMDRARLSLLTASDTLNRAGIYYLQDKATGSDGSWHSLLDESLAALQASEQAFARFERLSADAPEAPGALQDSYRLFYDGLKEQAQGLQGNSIDAFFAVPIQAFQADFNEKYLAYQALNERRGDDVNVRQLAALEQARTFALGALAALALIAVGVWFGVSRWVIAPLRQAIAHLNVLAAGDLSRPLPPGRAFNREMRQLQTSIGHMQGGLQRLVSEVRDAAGGILNGVGRLADGNRQLTAQSAKQDGELQLATEHVRQLAARVEENGQYAQQASQRTEQARQCAGAGERMMQTVNVSMQGIVNQSAEMRGIVALIDSVAFQTNILALNAAIEAAHAGGARPRLCHRGQRGGPVGAKEQPFDARYSAVDQPFAAANRSRLAGGGSTDGQPAPNYRSGEQMQCADGGHFPGVAQSGGEHSGRDGAHRGAESGSAANRHGGERGDRGFAAVTGRVGTVRKSDGALQAAGAINNHAAD